MRWLVDSVRTPDQDQWVWAWRRHGSGRAAPWGSSGRWCRVQRGGFDDIEHCAWAGPPMTTVHRPFAEMGVAAAPLGLALGRR